ncbi:hypothetical protein ABZ553_14760 [Streptomyces sparsogenes]|uniref:hypothetical protein n=1 Tax=Streptomyces sparsogenes TaxID=67365 RepID=UPI0033EA4D96
MTARTTCWVESLVPSWLLHDSGYRNALQQHLVDRIAVQGYEPAGPVRIRQADNPVPPPVGMLLLRVETVVEEFDVEVGEG